MGPAAQVACTSLRRGVWDKPTRQHQCRRHRVLHPTSMGHHIIHRCIHLSTIMDRCRRDMRTVEALGYRHIRKATLPRGSRNYMRGVVSRPLKKKEEEENPGESSECFPIVGITVGQGCMLDNQLIHFSPLILTYISRNTSESFSTFIGSLFMDHRDHLAQEE